jgi:heme-degrading monooxygenase HmoA
MAPSDAPSPVLVLLRTSLRPDCDVPAYEALEARMSALVSEVPGYHGTEVLTAEGGETIALVKFESREALLRWRNHPEHLEAQRAGRERFYATYDVRVCIVERAYDFSLRRDPERRGE